MNLPTFEDAIKSSRAFNIFLSDFRLGLGHAYMLVSPDDEIVSEYFSLVAFTIFCDTHSACGNCVGCRTVAHENNTDITYFNREHQKIKVEMVKDLISTIDIKPLMGKKLYFIERADLMNIDAQNKLLKTLEEPPEDVSFFLGVQNESAMLDTIKSRCGVIHMDIFDRKTVYDVLKSFGVEDDAAEIAAACSEGQLGKAKHIALSPEFAETYTFVCGLLKNLKRSANIIEYDNHSIVQKNTEIFLDILSIVLRDILALKDCPEVATSTFLKDKLMPLTHDFSERAIGDILLKINEVRKELSLNVNLTSAIDDLFFYILEEKFKWQP